MAKASSSMLPLGTLAPAFCLTDVITGKRISFNQDNSAIATVILFICNHCPYVKYVNPELIRLANDYIPQGIRFVAINSNDVTHYPDDSPEHMRETALALHYPFPYVFDETQEVALAYQAKCTPDFFVFDNNSLLVYRGQLDDARLGNNIPLTGDSIRTALDNILMNQPLCETQKPSLGCSIKWRV
jgi:thiol-disulfide isomerase/thioredoxin